MKIARSATLLRPVPLETAFTTLQAAPHPLFHPTRASLTLRETPGFGFEPDLAVRDRYRLSRTETR